MAQFASATLVFDALTGQTTTQITTGTLTLGRAAGNDVVVSDQAASGRHCELVVADGQLTLRDLGSSNGTQVNGQRIDSVTLYDGDVIRIGQTQGRVQVIGTDGKPLRPKTNKRPVIAVLAVVALVLVGGGAAFFMERQRRAVEHARFEEYEKKAAELLGRSPCQIASRLQVDFLQKHEGDAGQVALPHDGAFAPNDRQQDEELLASARKRDGQLTDIGTKLTERIAAQQTRAEELLKVKVELTDPALIRAVDAVDALFTQQRQIAQDHQKAWETYGLSVKQLVLSLDGLLKADPTTAQFAPVTAAPMPPTKIVETCEAAFRETRTKGLAQLAALAP